VTDYPNWFAQTAQHNFEQFLTPLAGEPDLKFLQLGVFTGDASVWMAGHILTDPFDAELVDVDTWQGSNEPDHDSMDFDDVYKTYLEKKIFYNCITTYRTTTVNYLTKLVPSEYAFDFIYVDADHTTVGVLLDAELSWPLLKSGGIMAFDDYTWGHESGDPRLAPMVGIDLFLHRHQLEYELLAKNTQVWIKKK
jgi:predicted O-methyltransferase YrrM